MDDLWPVLVQMAGDEGPVRRRPPSPAVELVVGLLASVVLATGLITVALPADEPQPRRPVAEVAR